MFAIRFEAPLKEIQEETHHFEKRTRACQNARFEKMSEASLSIGRQHVGAFLKHGARIEKCLSLNIGIQWNAGTACVSECVLKKR